MVHKFMECHGCHNRACADRLHVDARTETAAFPSALPFQKRTKIDIQTKGRETESMIRSRNAGGFGLSLGDEITWFVERWIHGANKSL